MSWLPLFNSLTMFILAFLLWASPVPSYWRLCPILAGCPAFRWRQLAATAGEGEAWSVPHAPFYPPWLSEPFAGDDWSGCLETSHGKKAVWARLRFSPCCRNGWAAKVTWWFTGISLSFLLSKGVESLGRSFSFESWGQIAFVFFSVASWFPFICNTEHLEEIPHSSSQTDPFTHFGVHLSCLILLSDTAVCWGRGVSVWRSQVLGLVFEALPLNRVWFSYISDRSVGF